MAYQTYAKQLVEHLHHLQSHGLDVERLQVDAGTIRCHKAGDHQSGRGDLAYWAKTNQMDNNLLIGLVTWCRGLDGKESTLKTYGLRPEGAEQVILPVRGVAPKPDDWSQYEGAASKAFGFWQHSNQTGESDYLKRKGVGSYGGIRFRSDEKYGNVAVIPMFDIKGWLWNYQILNADGTKRDAEGARTQDLFFSLRPLLNGSFIGVAEAYVTAATCMELSDVNCVSCFGSSNLVAVVSILLEHYPNSKLVIFADNDRHLVEKGEANKGLLQAHEAQSLDPSRVAIAAPYFVDCRPSKEASDWNDLVRLKGVEVARDQILRKIDEILKTTSMASSG